MSANTSPDLSIVGGPAGPNNGNPFPGLQQVTSCSSASRGSCFPQIALSSGNSYSSTTPAAMSAAAAAAFLLRTATGGSVNGDVPSSNPLPVRRCSTTSLFESPQASPSFHSSVISAAAQQAALAAAQAISSNSSPNSKASSDLQAAVLSLALAANPNNSLQPEQQQQQQQQPDRPNRTSQAVTDLFLLSERHPEILSSHPTLASVFRRRSSTVLPTYLSDLAGSDFGLQAAGSDRFPGPSVNMSLSSSLASALEAMNPQRPATSDLSGSLYSEHPLISTVGSSNPLLSSSFFSDHVRKESAADADPYRFSSATAVAPTASDLYGGKHASHYSPTFDPNMTGTRNSNQTGVSLSSGPDGRSFSRSGATGNTSTYRGSPRSDGTNLPHYSSYPATNCSRSATQINQSCVSPVAPVSHMTETNTPTTRMCPSSSPLSCSSLSNTGNSTMNISPVLLPDGTRGRGQIRDGDGLPCSDGKSGFHYSSQSRTGCLREHEIKSEYPSSLAAYQDEPSRKREQRLIKNREAARECRRKKKEYVKCLEARVSLLESQNQELIEELQKVKALCFNELCGLGLNSSTAACAAAVLAAVTSGPGTYSAAGTPTVSNVVKGSDRIISDVSRRLSDHISPNSSIPIDDSQTVTSHMDSTSHAPHRSRCQSVLSDTKIPPVIGSGNSSNSNGGVPSSAVYRSVCDSTQSDRPYLHDNAEVKHNSQNSNLSSHPPLTTDVTTGRVSPVAGAGVGPVYESRPVDSNDPYRNPSHVPHSHQPSQLIGPGHSRRLDSLTYQQHSPPKVGAPMSPFAPGSSTTTTTTAASTESNYYHHPHYAVKRAYRTMSSANPEIKSTLVGGQRQQQSDESVSDSADCRIKSNRPANPVAGAAVILAAAAAAIVAESESSDPRISV